MLLTRPLSLIDAHGSQGYPILIFKILLSKKKVNHNVADNARVLPSSRTESPYRVVLSHKADGDTITYFIVAQ